MFDLNVMKHGRTTNLEAGYINNIDALLVLMCDGLAKRKDLKDALDAWRRVGHGYLFNMKEASRMEGADRVGDKASFYRRTSKGTYELTQAGWRQVAKIHGVPVK
jgi:hypothetical protein